MWPFRSSTLKRIEVDLNDLDEEVTINCERLKRLEDQLSDLINHLDLEVHSDPHRFKFSKRSSRFK